MEEMIGMLNTMDSLHTLYTDDDLQRLKYIDNAGHIIPLIQYNNDDDEHLCGVFQIQMTSGKYIDLNVVAIARALTFISRR